jgi:hypothetical protein
VIVSPRGTFFVFTIFFPTMRCCISSVIFPLLPTQEGLFCSYLPYFFYDAPFYKILDAPVPIFRNGKNNFLGVASPTRALFIYFLIYGILSTALPLGETGEDRRILAIV